MSDRGMKKWAPYASLIEQKGTISSMKNNRAQFKKPQLSQDMANQMNECLLQAKDQFVVIDYFFDGRKHRLSGLVTKINYDQKWLMINEFKLSFVLILSIRIR